ncbi:MAG: discoidin domain-containing protein [Tepidisphaeraceae bacterium]
MTAQRADAARPDRSWALVVGSDELERTAAADIKVSLSLGDIVDATNGKAMHPAIVIGTPQDNPLIAAEHAKRPFVLDAQEPEGYHLAFRDGRLFVVGITPKGAMNGVFRLADKGAIDVEKLDEHAAPFFGLRAAGHKMNQSPLADWSEEDQARFYAKHYINLVWGEKHGPPMSYAARKKYGLGLMAEVRFPPRDEKWRASSANASAVYYHSPREKRQLISPFDPIGRKAYADAFRELLDANPDLKVLYALFGDYSVIPNEKSVRISDGQAYGKTRVETMREILAIMKDVIGDRDITRMAWMWHGFFDGGEEAFMTECAKSGIGILYNEAGNNDNWIIHRDNFGDLALKTGADGKIVWGKNYMSLVSAGGACESVNPCIAMPLPIVAAAKIRRLADADVRTFALWWGSGEGWVYQPNLEVIKEMIWDPRAFDAKDVESPDAPALLKRIAERDVGSAAPQVLKFWKALDDALVTTTPLYLPPDSPKRLPADADGLQIYDWYQRMGIFTETVFSQEFVKPLTPAVLSKVKGATGKGYWGTHPFTHANYADVLKKLAAADALLADLLKRNLPDDVQGRVRDMYQWAELYRHLLASQFNYLRGVTVMNRFQEHSIDSPEVRSALTPVVNDEIANLESMIAHVRTFPPNFNIAQPHLGVVRNQGKRDDEIAKLEAKRDAMTLWAGGFKNLALGAPATASSEDKVDRKASFATDGDTRTLWASKDSDDQWIAVDLGRAVDVQFVSVDWRNAWAKEYATQTSMSDDASAGAWKTAATVTRGGDGSCITRLPEGTIARQVRIQGVRRGTDWGYAIEEIAIFGAGERR